jgi:Family of unknown function (DUF6069)
MTRPIVPEGGRRRAGVGVDARRLWSGGVASAVVAGLVALVGVLVSRWLFKLPVLAPRRDGAYGDIRTTALVLLAVAAALVATGLVHLLMLGTPRPLMFFGWIVGLLTTLVVVFPFSTTAPLDAKIATALVDLVLGIVIGTLVGSAAARSTRTVVPTDEYPPPYDRPQAYERPQPYDQPPRHDPQPPYDRTQPYDQRYDPGRPGTGYP